MYQLNPNLRSFWTNPKPYKRLKGGRFSGKTHDAGGMAVFLARNYSLRFLCIRQFQNKIGNSVYTVLKDKIYAAGWQDEFDIQKTTITHKETGSDFIFYGMARNLDDIKGVEGVDVCWIEEGEGLTKEQWSVIDPTIRKEGSEIWILWNPRNEDDFIETELLDILGDDCVTRHINYPENPFLSNSAIDKAARLKEADEDEYNHIYRGIPHKSGGNRIMSRAWLEECIDAHKVLPDLQWEGNKTVGYDVADDGEDKNAISGVDGSIIRFVDDWSAGEDEMFKSCTRVVSEARKFGAKDIGYDSIGVGAGCGSNFNQIGFEDHYKFNAGATVFDPKGLYDEESEITNGEFYSNLKAQAWWELSNRVLNTYNAITKGMEFEATEMISFDSERIGKAKLRELITELSTPLKHYDTHSKVKVESKQDLRKRKVKSPNLADSVIIAVSKHLTLDEVKPAGILLRRR